VSNLYECINPTSVTLINSFVAFAFNFGDAL